MLEAYRLSARGDAYDPEPSWKEDMGHLEIDLPGPFNPDFHFNNLDSDLLAMRVIPASWAPVIESFLRFEIRGEEIKVNNFGNINFERLSLTLRLELTRGGNRIDLVGWLDEIDAAVDRAEEIRQSNLVFVRTRFRNRT